jgi:hypothetical protein
LLILAPSLPIKVQRLKELAIMKIDQSLIGFSSEHLYSRLAISEESVSGRIVNRPAAAISPVQTEWVSISPNAQQAAATDSVATSTENQTDPKLQLLFSLIESMTGQKVMIFNGSELKISGNSGAPASLKSTAPSGTPQPPAPASLTYSKHTSLHEVEQTHFNAQGVVKTADGKEIRFQLSLSMQREFVQDSTVTMQQGKEVKQDPLVINFNGQAAELTDSKFSFDLNSDGHTEQISFLGSGSGFLALDKNGNGRIDNGSELFGTQSGNGFADLAAYDSDGNQWIDENDAVFAKLKVYNKDASGADTLSTLAQHGVGALYLGSLSTSFDLKNSANQLQGQVRSSGVYLNENGSIGSLQQIDLVV